jgi:NADH-quinone oxidoreductase subunit K
MSNLIFFIGIIGLSLIRKHLIIILLAIELIFLAINFNFLIFSVILDDFFGQIFMLIIIILAGVELAIGLSILILFYKLYGGITLDLIDLLKG